jgi:hypothetical protein
MLQSRLRDEEHRRMVGDRVILEMIQLSVIEEFIQGGNRHPFQQLQQ